MKRGNGLQRRTGLARGPLQLTRKAPLARTVMRRQPAQQPQERPTGQDWSPEVRAAALARSGGLCEPNIRGECTELATDLHHRKRRGEGDHGPANALHCCRRCHSWLHGEPLAAKGLGWIVKPWSDPATTPVLVRGRRVMLTVDGGYREVAP